MFTLLMTLSLAQAAGLPGLELTRGATTMCLANGLRLGFVSQRDRPIVGVAMAHRAGAREDSAAQPGLAHLIEHLTFEVRDADGATRTERLDALGALHNAWTGHDTVTYLAVAPRRAVRSLLELEVERLLHPLDGLAERDFLSEREVVRQEIVESGGDVAEPMNLLYSELLGPDHPYAWSVGGTPGEIATMTMADASAFAAAHYATDGAALVLVGDFSEEKGWQLLMSALPEQWRASASDCPSVEAIAVPEPPEQRSWPERTADVDEPVALFGWAMPPGAAGLRFADYLATVVSRRLDDGSCWADGRELATVLACSIEGGRSLPKAPLTRTSRDMADARGDAGHLLHVIHRYYALSEREYISTSFETVGVSSTGMLASLARDLLQTGSMHWSARPSGDRFPASAALTWGARWLDADRARGVQLVPPLQVSGSASEAHAPRLPSAVSGVVPTDDDIREMLAWPSFEGFRTAQLENGTRVSFLPHDGPPTVVFEARHHGPMDPWLWAGTEDWIDDVWSALDAGDRTDAFRAHTIPRMSTTSEGIRIESVAGQPLVAIATIGSALRDGVPVVRKREAAQTRAEYDASREEAIADPDVAAYAAVWAKLAGGHPHPWLDDEGFARVVAVERPDASQLLNTIAAPGSGHIVVVGGLEEWDAVLAAAKKSLEKRRAWGKAGAEVVPPDRPASPTSASLQVVSSASTKARVYVACRIDEGSGAQRQLLEVHLRDRLNESLRERLALTYGVSVWRSRTWLGELLWIESSVPADQAGLTLERILGSVDEVAGGELDATLLQRLKATVARQSALEYQAPTDFADLILAVVGDESEEDAPSFADSLLAVTPESLGESLGQCVGRTQAAIVGDAAIIRASLAEAGLETTD